MFDYSSRIEKFRDNRVRLSTNLERKLLDHRKANRDRLILRLPDEIKGVTLGEASFRPQGSFAMGTVIQNRFVEITSEMFRTFREGVAKGRVTR